MRTHTHTHTHTRTHTRTESIALNDEQKKRESSKEIFLGGHRAGASIALPLKFKRYGEHSPGDSMRRNDLLEARQLMCSDF